MADGGLTTSMGLDFVRLALDKRIEETTAELIQLKRSRNSFLAVTRVSPEILGYIFRLSITPGAAEGHFAGLQEDSYNFLLVCQHWSEVARRTPELWGFWGNSLEIWKRQHPRSGTTPLDLVLDVEESRAGSVARVGGRNRYSDEAERQAGLFDGTLQDALRDHTARGAIRKVHIRSDDIQLSTTILSTLTPEDEVARDSNIESIALDGVIIYLPTFRSRPPLRHAPTNGVDASNFFSRHRFPKLQNLSLSGRVKISPWAWRCLTSNATALTDLSLSLNQPFSDLKTSQILLLLASNPNIRSLKLVLEASVDDGIGPKLPVPLRHLEDLYLKGQPHRVFSTLRRVRLPERVDRTRMEFFSHTTQEAREAIVPHIWDYLRRDRRFEGRLGVCVWVSRNTILLHVGVFSVEDHVLGRVLKLGPPYATFSMTHQHAPPEERDRLCIYTLAHLPQESIVYLETNLSAAATKEVVVGMPNLEVLSLIKPTVSNGFLLPNPDGPNPHAKLLPSLRRLYLQDANAPSSDWGPLVRYVTHQTSGGLSISLDLHGTKDIEICPRLVEKIEGLVEQFGREPGPSMKQLLRIPNKM